MSGQPTEADIAAVLTAHSVEDYSEGEYDGDASLLCVCQFVARGSDVYDAGDAHRRHVAAALRPLLTDTGNRPTGTARAGEGGASVPTAPLHTTEADIAAVVVCAYCGKPIVERSTGANRAWFHDRGASDEYRWVRSCGWAEPDTADARAAEAREDPDE